MLEIEYASSPFQIDMVRGLIRGFHEWSKTRYEAHLVKIYFENEQFKAELRDLPGKLVRPTGNLLLATVNKTPAGCIGMFKITDDVCEMTRMFVAPTYQRKGIGQTLVRQLVREAGELGYKQMRLDTGSKQTEAQAMYKKLGFVEIAPPADIPEEFKGMVISMELPLQGVA